MFCGYACFYADYYSRLCWKKATVAARKSFLGNEEIDATIDGIRRKVQQELGDGSFNDGQASIIREFLLWLPLPAPCQSLAIQVWRKEGRAHLAITIYGVRSARRASCIKKIDKTAEINSGSPEGLAIMLTPILKFLAMRYKDVVTMTIENKSGPTTLSANEDFGVSCLDNISLQTMLRPFAEAGYWTTSLKRLDLLNFDLWLDDDSTDLRTYPEHLEVVNHRFRDGYKINAKSNLFQIMEKSNRLTLPDTYGHFGKISYRAVKCYCEMFLKHTPFRKDFCPPKYMSVEEYQRKTFWGEFNRHVMAHNHKEVIATLKSGAVFDGGVERLFNLERREAHFGARILAVVYHYSALRRFRTHLPTYYDENDQDSSCVMMKKKGHLLIPMFLATLQTTHVGETDHRERIYACNLLFAIVREYSIEIAHLALR